MKPGQISTNFNIREFVPKEIFEQYGNRSVKFIDYKLVTIAEALKHYFNCKIIINNWAWGGSYNLSGFRPFDCGIGANFSQHKFGRAADLKLEGYEPEEIRQHIRKHFKKYQSRGLTRIENNTPTWIHIDCAFTGLNYLFEFNP